MAATTITDYGTELLAATPSNNNYAPMQPNIHYGRVRRSHFSLNLAAISPSANESFAVVRLPKGARLGEGRIYFPDCGGTVTLDIGLAALDGSGLLDEAGLVSDDVDFLTQSGVIDVSTAAGQASFNEAQDDLGIHYETEKELYLTVTFVSATTVATSGIIYGHLDYVVD